MNLFQLGDFTLRSGQKSAWKIECDALTPGDWTALARMATEILPGPFSRVLGVPQGGFPFALALGKYATADPTHPLLIAEDVVTTGGSTIRFVESELPHTRPGVDYVAVCVFARGPYPDWIKPLFAMPGAWPIKTGDGE